MTTATNERGNGKRKNTNVQAWVDEETAAEFEAILSVRGVKTSQALGHLIREWVDHQPAHIRELAAKVRAARA